MEQTLMLIKPDGVATGHIGEVISRLERRQFTITALKVVPKATTAQLTAHYADKVNEPFFPGLVSYMQSGPLVALIISGTDVVHACHQMAGATKPSEALPGTIRGDFGRLWDNGAIKNVVHSSDRVEAAAHEIDIWFPELSDRLAQ